MESFPDRLKQAIKKAGYSRSEFSEKCGIGTSVLAKWLSGKLTPKSSQLLRLARVADVSMEWLLTGESKYPISMEDSLDEALADLKKLLSGELDDPAEEQQARAFLRNMLEGQDEDQAAIGTDGRPDLLKLVEMLESAFQDFARKFMEFNEVLESVEVVGDQDSEIRVIRALEESAYALKRLKRRKQGLVSEVLARNETEAW